jgi:radical SAM superfamily enzyme YgiQ (UPF0313 family)
VRLKSPVKVLDEIKNLKAIGVEHFMFADDTFLLDLGRVKDFCKMVIDNNISITWSSAGRVSPISQEVLGLMKKAGCFRIFFGVESGSPRILNNISKNITPDQILSAFSMTRKAGIDALAFIMAGNPGENDASISETIEIIKKCKPEGIIAGLTQIFPGTGLEKLAKSKGGITDGYWLTNRYSPIYTCEHDALSLSLFLDRIKIAEFWRNADITSAFKESIVFNFKRLLKVFGLYKIAYNLRQRLRKRR